MAYANRYYAGWHNSLLTGYVYIDQWDYVGASPERLQLLADAISIVGVFDDWNSPIMGMRCSLSILNDRAD